jgi:hypothetical protein
MTPYELAQQLDGARYVRVAPWQQLIYVWFGQRSVTVLDADGAALYRLRVRRGNAVRFINARCQLGVRPSVAGRYQEVP